MVIAFSVLLFGGLGLAPKAQADGGAEIVWTASKVRGTVSYRESGMDGVRWIPLKTGALLSALAQLKTGPDGHAELSYEGSTIVAAPNSEMHLPGTTSKNAVYRVTQNVGTLLYKIKHASRDKFEVQTPYLTTIIKGTIFSVLAGPAGSSVHVTEGAVFVRPSQGQGGAFVRPGETARVNSNGRDRVTVQGGRSNPGNNTRPAPDTGDKAQNSSSVDDRAPGKPAAANEAKGKPVKIVFRDAARRDTAASLGKSPVGASARGRDAKNSPPSDPGKGGASLTASLGDGLGNKANHGAGSPLLGNGNAGGNGNGNGAANTGSLGGGVAGGLGGGNAGGLGGGNAGGLGGGNAGDSGGGNGNAGAGGNGNGGGNGNAGGNGNGNGKKA